MGRLVRLLACQRVCLPACLLANSLLRCCLCLCVVSFAAHVFLVAGMIARMPVLVGSLRGNFCVLEQGLLLPNVPLVRAPLGDSLARSVVLRALQAD